jgi:hypothetical protein
MAGFEIEDFSELRAPASARVKVPLNGEVYWATPEPEADVVLMGMGTITPEIAEAQAAAQEAQAAGRAEEWMKENPRLAVLLQSASATTTERAVQFLQDVLEPESAQRFADAMRPLPNGSEHTKAERDAHERRRITLPQMMAVYRALIGSYAGGRPTSPPSSSRNGRGGTGRTSTGGRSRKV